MRAVLHQPSEATGEGTRAFEAKDLEASVPWYDRESWKVVVHAFDSSNR